MVAKINIPVSISLILLLAFCVRMTLVVLMFVFDVGPQEWSDESSFYTYATFWLRAHLGTASQYQLDSLVFISGSIEYSISLVLSFFMLIFSDSLVLARLLSVVAGVGAVYLVYQLTFITTNKHSFAKLAALALAIFPTQIVYSIMVTREPYIVLFILLGLWLLLLYSEKNNIRYIIAYIGCVIVENYMHGGVAFVMTILGLIFPLIYFKINIPKVILLSSITLAVIFLVDFTYVNTLKDLNFDFILKEMLARFSGNMSYGVKVDSFYSLLIAIPELILKFLVGFPFQEGFNGTVLIINSLLWMLFLIMLFLYLPSLYILNPQARLIIIAMLFFIAVFSISSTNYGTTLRHKSKFTPLLIILAVSSLSYSQRQYGDYK